MHCLLLLKFNEDKIRRKKSYDEIFRALIYSQKKKNRETFKIDNAQCLHKEMEISSLLSLILFY